MDQESYSPNIKEGNGAFDPEELSGLAREAEGDEFFLVTETGKIVFANDEMLSGLGYTSDEIRNLTVPGIDKNKTRADWLHLVSSLKKSGRPVRFETKHFGRGGIVHTKQIFSKHIFYKGKGYVLCVSRRLHTEKIEMPPPPPVESRESIIMNTIKEGIIVVDTKGMIVESNAAAEKIFGAPRSDIIGRPCIDPKWRLVDMRGNAIRIPDHPAMVTLVEEAPVNNKRLAMIQPDGSLRFLTFNTAPLYSEAGYLVGALTSIRPENISEENIEDTRRSSRFLTLHREIVNAVIRADSIDELERKVCDMLVAAGDYPLVWVGAIRPNDPRVHPNTWAGAAIDYLFKIKIKYDDSEFGKGPIGICIRTKKPQVVGNTQDDRRYGPWKKQAAKKQLHSVAIFPLLDKDEVFGFLAVYSQNKHHFQEGELALLGEIAEMLSFGVLGIRARQEQNTLKTEALKQRRIVEAMRAEIPTPFCLFEAKPPFKSLMHNPAYRDLMDEPYHSRGVNNLFLIDYQHTHIHSDLIDRLQQVLTEDARISEEGAKFRSWDGIISHWNWSVTPVKTNGEISELFYQAARCDNKPFEREVPSDNKDTCLNKSDLKENIGVEENQSRYSLIRIICPEPPPRSKKEKKLELFFEEGQIAELTPYAVKLLGIAHLPFRNGNRPGEIFPPEGPLREGIENALTSRRMMDRTFTVDCIRPGKSVPPITVSVRYEASNDGLSHIIINFTQK